MAIPQFHACNAVQALNKEMTTKDEIGYITKLKIGKESFEDKITVYEPEKQDDKKCAAVCSSVDWDGSTVGRLTMHFFTNNKNYLKYAEQVDKGFDDITIKFDFIVWKFDINCDPQKWYEVFESKKEIESKAVIEAGGGYGGAGAGGGTQPAIHIDTYQYTGGDIIGQQHLHAGWVSLFPPIKKVEVLHYALNSTNKKSTKWGSTSGE